MDDPYFIPSPGVLVEHQKNLQLSAIGRKSMPAAPRNRHRSLDAQPGSPNRQEMWPSAAAKRTMARDDDVPLMRAVGARILVISVYRGAEKMRTRVDTRRVNVKVLSEVTHFAVEETTNV